MYFRWIYFGFLKVAIYLSIKFYATTLCVLQKVYSLRESHFIVLGSGSQDPSITLLHYCFNLMCMRVSASAISLPSYAPLPLNSLFREGLSDSPAFTMLIPLLRCWNANVDCSAGCALIMCFCPTSCCFESVENPKILPSMLIWQLPPIINVFGY